MDSVLSFRIEASGPTHTYIYIHTCVDLRVRISEWTGEGSGKGSRDLPARTDWQGDQQGVWRPAVRPTRADSRGV